MFYLKYLFAEIFRRLGKTFTIVSGLAIASAIIVLIMSISQSLSESQKKVLNPLENVGTDILVSRSVSADKLSEMDETTSKEYREENRVDMNLSKLGNPGETFSSDQFLPGTMLTFEANTTDKLDKNTVTNSAKGLILNISHREGTVPNVTAEFETGGEKIQVNQEIAPMSDADRAAGDAARQKAQVEIQAKGLDPHSEEARQLEREAMNAAMPDRFKRFSGEVTTERRKYTQDVGPISTDIKTENYSISGVDTTKTDIGLILPSQITDGKYFDGIEGQIIVNRSYADKQSKKVGDKIALNKVEYIVVGIVDPKLYTNTTDFYLPLAELQKISGKTDRVNILLVKIANAKSVDEASKTLEQLFTGAKVINSKDTAQKVSGSLIQASNLTKKFIGVTSIIIIFAAFVIVSLLTISSINKRVREIGTLKAIGWSNAEVVRQIVSESIVLGLFGAVLGIGLGLVAIAVLNHYNISFDATVQSMNSSASNMLGRFMRPNETSQATANVETSVQLNVAISYTILLIGAGVAVLGALVSGFFAALKVSRLKPQVALRNLE